MQTLFVSFFLHFTDLVDHRTEYCANVCIATADLTHHLFELEEFFLSCWVIVLALGHIIKLLKFEL